MKKDLLLMLLTVIIFSSCKKSPPLVNQTYGCKISVFEHVGTESYFFTYDDQGRVTKRNYDNKQSERYTSFTYESDRIVVADFIYGQRIYYLDAKGRIVSQGDWHFKYNNEGYLIEAAEVRRDLKYVESYSYGNGDLIAITVLRQIPGSSSNSSVSLSYNSEPLQDLSLIANSYPPSHLSFLGPFKGELLPFFGKLSKNLIAKYTYRRDGVPEQVITYNYHKYSNERIHSVDRHVSGSSDGFYNSDSNYKVSYQCK